MYRILICLAMAGLVMTGAAFAQDNQWGDDPVISDDPVDEADETGGSEASAPATAPSAAPAAAQEHEPLSADQLGMYFGIDGDLRQHNPAESRADRAVDYHDQQIIFPEYSSGTYSSENVYGPMWGVPSEAVGLEGYDPYYYYVLSGGDLSQLTDEQRREIEARMKSAGAAAAGTGEAGHTHTSGDTEVADAELEGIKLTDDYWD